jgi:hypothetical protein
MLRPKSESPRLHLERARDHEGSSKTSWCADHGVKYASKPPGMYENGEKTPFFFLLKSTQQDIPVLLRRFLRNTLILKFLLHKVMLTYAPSCPD